MRKFSESEGLTISPQPLELTSAAIMFSSAMEIAR